MIFRLLGHGVRRFWPLILLAWGAVLVGTDLTAPSWDRFAQDREFEFLPPDSPSRRAAAEFAKAFPEDRTVSNIVLVLQRGDGNRDHVARDRKFIDEVLYPALRHIADEEGGLASETAPTDEPLFGDEKPAKEPRPRSIITQIHTPSALGIGPLLVSADGRAMLVLIELTTDYNSASNWPTIDKVEKLVHDLGRQGKLPPGDEIFVTGSAVIGRDHTWAEGQSAHATETWTMILVVALLILIYRAPLLAAIPLVTVALSVHVSLNVLLLLARAGWVTLFQGIQIYVTILAYGAGVDYCLFLTARYREELDRGATPADAVATAVGAVGGALVASGATVGCGIAMMLFAEFGKFREAGLAIPLSILLVLVATLTFSPALLRLAGRWAFWPLRPCYETKSRPCEGEAPSFLVRIWDDVAHHLLRRPGWAWLITVAAMAPFALVGVIFHGMLSYDMVGDLPASAPSVAGTRVMQAHFPAGLIGQVNVLLVNPHVDFGSDEGRALVGRLTDRLRARQEELGLDDVRTLTAPLGITKAAVNPFADMEMTRKEREDAARRLALDRYTTAMGGRTRIGTRMDLVLSHSPFSTWSMADLDRIEAALRAALPAGLRQDTRIDVGGTTASVRDLADAISRDRVRISVLVLACVLVILVLLLRRLVVPLYLLLSVLLSYVATLGVTLALFWLLDPHGFTGIDWKVAIFLFTILIAVGEDYNIFLLARVHEEEKQFGPVRGVTEALTRTGPIISSCGIIMAGTFGSLMAGTLYEMKQLGFALAFGVLLDTFVVRPLLVPAFLILWGNRRQPLASQLGPTSSPVRVANAQPTQGIPQP